MWDNLARDLPLVTWYIGVLVFLEGLLSADNALVLALMVRHLSRHDRRRVLQWGIWGAIGFRVVAVLLSTILLKFWFFKVFGGLYLLYLALSHFWSHHKSAGAGEAQQSKAHGWLHGFWGTVAAVTVTDIVFSIDSIVTAVAMADDFPDRFGYRGKLFIVLTGGVLGIITMRFVVRYFISLLDRFPGLAEGAYYLVAWIGLKLTISGVSDGFVSYYGEKVHPFHMPDSIFWTGMAVIVILSFLIKPRVATQQTRTEASDRPRLYSKAKTNPWKDSGASEDDDPDRGRPGRFCLPDSPDARRERPDAPPDDHAIAAEQSPDESANARANAASCPAGETAASANGPRTKDKVSQIAWLPERPRQATDNGQLTTDKIRLFSSLSSRFHRWCRREIRVEDANLLDALEVFLDELLVPVALLIFIVRVLVGEDEIQGHVEILVVEFLAQVARQAAG